MNRQSFSEHYLRHVALGEGCNCAESVLRTTGRTALTDESSGSFLRAFRVALTTVLNRSRRRRAKLSG